MSWISPPLQGRNGGLALSSSTPQLPRLVPPAGCGASAESSPSQSQRVLQDFLPISSSRRVKENDRGLTAAAWSRKLPCGVPSQAMRMVRTHLSPVEDAMASRHTTKLEKAMEDATNGNNYLKTISAVRRSKSVPAMQRHALEAALATHIVRAKVELDKWHTGIIKINELRRLRNADKLQNTLACWQFAEDDPVVLEAREDLERWRYIEEQMPAVLKQAVEEKDIETIRHSLKQLNMSGPSNVQGAREARAMLKRYDAQARVLKEAVRNRQVDAISAAIDNWEFPEDANVDEGRETLQRREDQLGQLEAALDAEKVNGNELIAAVTSWEFESDDECFRRAVEVLQAFRMEADGLDDILRHEHVNLLQLRLAVDSWSFATDPDCCEVLHEATTLLATHEEEVRAAIAASDGHALRELLAAGCDGDALGDEELRAEANALNTRHAEASNRLLELVRSAPDLEASVKEDIEEHCQNWAFSDTDPVLGLGRTWLRLHASVAENTASELKMAAESGFEGPALRALSRQQALATGSAPATAAQAVVGKVGKTWQAAGALALGVPPSRLPAGESARTFEAIQQELKRAETVIHNVTPDLLREAKGLARAPEGVHECLQLVQKLLAGSSSYKLGNHDDSWKSCQEMLGARFLDHLGEVLTFISTARRTGVVEARALDKKHRAGPMAECWSAESLGRSSVLCQHLFVYVEHILRYDDLISFTFTSSPVQSEQAPSAGCEAASKAFQTALQKNGGLPDSKQLAALFATCGAEAADPVELQDCEDRAMTLVEAAKERMLQLQGALEDLSPLDGLGHHPSDHHEDHSDPPRMLTLSVKMSSSGPPLGKIEVSETSTGSQLKYIIAGQTQFDAPKSSEQRLLHGDVIVRDHVALYKQGIRNGASLTLVRVEVSLLRRLEMLASAFRTLDSASLTGPGVKHLVKAASYFASEAQPHAPKRIDPALKVFVEFLKDAILFVQAVGKGMKPRSTCISVVERKIQVHMFEYAELPGYHFATAIYHLTCFTRASESESAAYISEFIAVLLKLQEEFLPNYLAWSASQHVLAEAEHTCTVAMEASRIGQQLIAREEGGIFSLEPSALFAQLESLSNQGIVVAAPHIEALTKAATVDVEELLESSDIADPAKRARFVEKLLAAQLAPAFCVTEVLSRLAKHLFHAGAMPHDIGYMTPVYQLVMAAIRIVSKPGEIDITFADARKLLEKPGALAHRLETWRPMQDGSVAQLRSAETALLGLWGTFRTGTFHSLHSHDERHRTLFAWASLAVSMAPLLEAAAALAPAHTAVKAAAGDMKRQATETSVPDSEEIAWQKVREALRDVNSGKPTPGEPWLWLRLVGCKDPEAYYVKNDLKIETKKIETPIKVAEDVMAAGYPADQATTAPPQRTSPERAADANEQDVSPIAKDASAIAGDNPSGDDTYAFDQSRTANEESYAFDQEPSGAQEQDPYGQAFDESEADNAASPGRVGSAYSQDDFEFEGDRSVQQPAKASPNPGAYSQDEDAFENDEGSPPNTAGERDYTAEFEADFEQADDEAGDDEFQNFPARFDDANSSNQLTAKDRARSDSNEFEFEAEDSGTVKHRDSQYSNSEFEGDNTPVEKKLPGGKNGATDFEAEDEYNDFEEDED